MSSKFVLDTNFLIPVEDPRATPGLYADLLRDIAARGHSGHVHEASISDIRRDRDEARRAVSLSKLRKYPVVGLSWRQRSDLEIEFGDIRSENDLCDCHILSSVKDRVADFIVTQDSGLHARAARVGLGDKVLTVRQALDFINETYARSDYSLRSIRKKKCHQLNPKDPIFDSLRSAYDGFDRWLADCAASARDCWVVEDGSALAGVVIIKEEVGADLPSPLAGRRVLKLCTFKVSDEFRGGRLGEQLLRQAMCHAYDSDFDGLYLTTYEHQASLRELVEHYGFRFAGTNERNELIYGKVWDRSEVLTALDYNKARCEYPVFPYYFTEAYVVPVRPIYHDRLFPEALSRVPDIPGQLFDGVWSQGDAVRSSPSNSIRKSYLCNAQTSNIVAGSLLAFYRSQDVTHGIRAQLTAIGLAESYERSVDANEAIASISKRSVYLSSEITEMVKQKGSIKILKFLFYGYLNPPILLAELVRNQILSGPPQSITKVRSEKQGALVESIRNRLVSA